MPRSDRVIPTSGRFPGYMSKVGDAWCGYPGLLASRFNTKLCRFFSRSGYPLVEADNALVTWLNQHSMIYAFPPLKVQHAYSTGLIQRAFQWHLITPNWFRWMGYSDLVKLLKDCLCILGIVWISYLKIYSTAGFNGMNVEAQVWRVRGLFKTVIPVLLNAIYHKVYQPIGKDTCPAARKECFTSQKNTLWDTSWPFPN